MYYEKAELLEFAVAFHTVLRATGQKLRESFRVQLVLESWVRVSHRVRPVRWRHLVSDLHVGVISISILCGVMETTHIVRVSIIW